MLFIPNFMTLISEVKYILVLAEGALLLPRILVEGVRECVCGGGGHFKLASSVKLQTYEC